jgi:macrophage erythroblast attacher
VALISQFRRENFGIHNLSSLPLIFVALQAGLSALKTPNCYIDANKNINCPVCAPSLGSLAERLPFSHHTNSCIVCRVTGEIMDENNPPLVLPNGNVYSTKALQDLAKNNGGKVIDPRSGQTYDLSQAKKAFLA